MPQRGSDKHGPRQDDELKHELQGMGQADRRVRVEEWRDPEPPADDDPASYTAPEAGVNAQTVADAMTRRLVSVPVDASITDAATAMRDHDVGDVLVLRGGAVRGILTDRDVVVRALAEGLDLGDTSVEDVLSEDVMTVAPNTPVDEAVTLMRENAIRRLPVVDEDLRPLGVVSLGDLAVSRQPQSPLADISSAPANR